MQSYTTTRLAKLNKGRKLVKLDIGSGGYSSDDTFLSVDLYTEADIIAPMWDIPLPNESVDVIFSSQALEHVGKNDVLPTLREWERLLKSGGRLQLIVPDLEWACQWWLANQTTGWPMDVIYGNQKHEGEFHKTGFSQKILLNYFTQIPLYIHKIEYIGGTRVDFLRLSETSRVHVEGRSINLEAEKP